jgi:hypothetical protein
VASLELNEVKFLADVKDHGLTILRDDGVYRHVRLAKPGTMCMHFDLITWPGYLAYVGDMGAFTFRRLYDMFEFFRSDREPNLEYWGEKLDAVDRGSGYKEFDEDSFSAAVNSYRLRWIRDAHASGDLDKSQRRELWEAVDYEVLSRASDGEFQALEAVYDFERKVGGKTYRFDDFFDHNLERPTFRFRWACYAIAWGIHQYDLATEMPAIAEKDAS